MIVLGEKKKKEYLIILNRTEQNCWKKVGSDSS